MVLHTLLSNYTIEKGKFTIIINPFIVKIIDKATGESEIFTLNEFDFYLAKMKQKRTTTNSYP